MSNPDFKLEHLFGSKTRARLLGLFLMHPETAFFVRELTRKIDAQLNSVRRELKNLIDLGLVVERVGDVPVKTGAALSEKKKYYIVNVDFILFEDLRQLFKKVQLLLKNGLVQDLSKVGGVDYLAFTGRFIERTDMPTDLFIVGSVSVEDVQRTVAALEKELGHEVNYTLMSREEFKYRRELNDRFIQSIVRPENIVTVNTIDVV